MATITLKGNPIRTSGELPPLGAQAPAFILVNTQLEEVGLERFAGQQKVLNIFPSLDTPVCATSVRSFTAKAGGMQDVVVLNISADLPFAHKRFCTMEDIEGVEALSTFRSSFADDYGVAIVAGPMEGLCARAVVVLDAQDKVIYTEQVPEIAQEPNYDAALAVL